MSAILAGFVGLTTVLVAWQILSTISIEKRVRKIAKKEAIRRSAEVEYIVMRCLALSEIEKKNYELAMTFCSGIPKPLLESDSSKNEIIEVVEFMESLYDECTSAVGRGLIRRTFKEGVGLLFRKYSNVKKLKEFYDRIEG
jgi:hypothetical protein